MKNKKHWNSFTTDYFIPLRELKGLLSKQGKVQLQSKAAYEAMLKEPLRCNRCRKDFGASMAALKKHLAEGLC
jgi:aprataxin